MSDRPHGRALGDDSREWPDEPDDCPAIIVTFFSDYAAATKREQVLDLTDLARRIETTTGPDKAHLPWLKCARFGDSRTDRNSLRHDANLIAITGVEGDYDGEKLSFEDARAELSVARLLAIMYTSPGHREDAPRWRVVCPLSQEYPPDQRDRFLARLNGLFGGIFSRESWTLSQSYYFGSVNSNPSHRVVVLDGTPLDLAHELDVTAIGRPAKPNGSGHAGPATPPEDISDKRIAALIDSLLDNLRTAADGTKHHTLFDIGRTLGGYLHVIGWSEHEAVEQLCAALPSSVEDWDVARKTAAQAVALGATQPLELKNRPDPRQRHLPAWMLPTPPPDDIPELRLDEPAQLPTILCVPGQLDRMYREAEAALRTVGAPIYQRTMLVRPTVVEYDAAPPSGSKEPRTTHSTALVAVTAPALTKMLSRAAIFMKWNERKKQNVVCDPPSKLVDIILASRGEWTFPVVRGVLTTPTLRPDGSVLKTPGYDPISRYYLTFPSNLVLPDIPEAPTREQAAESLQRLDHLLDGYAFADETGVFRAVALAMLMTQVLRCAMPVSPLEAVSATAPGTGKSHLVDLASTIAIGRPCPIINAGKNDEETEKGINTKLISGIPGFSIDNVQRELNLEALNTATERPLLSPRKFGVLEDIEVENGVVIYMTGNNLAIIDEQVRRTVLCKMDAKVEQPEQRAFATDPIATVLADRGRYIADILTIARAYLTNGTRPDIPPYGSYPEWSRFVREPLVWLGQPDPLLSQNSARANDTALDQRRDIINAWHVAFGTGARTMADAARYATTVPVHGGYDPADTEAERDDKLAAYHAHRDAQQQLLAVLRAAFPSGRDGIDIGKWGYWMRRFAGRMTDGLKFVNDGVTHGTGRWRLTY